MKLGEVKVDDSAVTHEFKVGDETIEITGKPATRAMYERAARRVSPKISGDGKMIDVMSSVDSNAEMVVEIVTGWEGVTDADDTPVGCNNETKRQMARQYPMTAGEIIEFFTDLYQQRLKEREEHQGNS